MSRKIDYGIVKCPNGCEKTFKLNFKGQPKGLEEHLKSCGGVFSFADAVNQEGAGDGSNRLFSNE